MPDDVKTIGERYWRDGYASPITVMTETEALDLRRRIEAFEREHGVTGTEILNLDPHICVPFLYDLSLNETILDAVESAIGPDIMCWSTGFFTKEAHDPHFISWHQDLRYWGLKDGEEITAWLALSQSTVDSGCVRVVPGSHEWGIAEHKEAENGINMLSRGQYIPNVKEEDGVDRVLRPGQMSQHHGRTAHASRPNQSDDRRIGFTIRYITPNNTPKTEIPHWAHLCRGKDPYGNFNDVARPQTEMARADVDAWNDKTRTMMPIFYEGTEQPEWKPL